jgi:hypothetical protein
MVYSGVLIVFPDEWICCSPLSGRQSVLRSLDEGGPLVGGLDVIIK